MFETMSILIYYHESHASVSKNLSMDLAGKLETIFLSDVYFFLLEIKN